MFRFTIFQKGLLIISLPLVCEGLFGWYLWGQLQDTKAQLERESQARELIWRVDQFRRYCTQGSFMALATASSKDPLTKPVVRSQWQQCEQAMNFHLYKAQELCRNNPEQLKLISQVYAADQEGRALLRSVQNSKDPLNEVLPYEAMASLNHPFIKVRVNADKIVARENAIVQDSTANRIKALKNITEASLAALGFNALLAVALTAYFARNITNRLRFVMDNTRRMVRREALSPVVGGTDEIAELDVAIHRTADELNELEKFKRELTAMVTHELRTPLTSVQGVLSLLRLGAMGELTAVAKKNVEMAEQNTHRLLKLINDLLDIEKMEAGKLDMVFEPVLLNDVIQQSLVAVQAFAQQYEVELQTSIVDCYVTADNEWLQQVIINLVSNAVKYSPKGGVVRVVTHVYSTAAEVRVIDQGRGIPEEFRERVFDKFQQVSAADRREKKGTGLGLAICKGIIEQHRGSIGVESEMGAGSQFWFTLPLAQSSDEDRDDRSYVLPNQRNTSKNRVP